MVKIRELSDSQLVAQVEKYEKIYFQLVNERDKRVELKGENPLLYTRRERELKKLEQVHSQPETPVGDESTKAYQLKFDESEIAQINEAEKALEVPEESTEDEVRVTQLLKLSKEQLEELRNPGKAKVVKKVVKKKIKKKIKK
jgi:hypothetical protein